MMPNGLGYDFVAYKNTINFGFSTEPYFYILFYLFYFKS